MLNAAGRDQTLSRLPDRAQAAGPGGGPSGMPAGTVGDASAWTVRPATAADAPALARLCAAHAAYEHIPYEAEGHAQRLADALDSGRLHAWLVLADEDPEPSGYASVTLDYATLAGAPFLHLDCLYLQPPARGQGLGAALMDTVIAHARAAGCRELQWQTPDWNTDAIRFYDRLGARRRGKQRYTLAW